MMQTLKGKRSGMTLREQIGAMMSWVGRLRPQTARQQTASEPSEQVVETSKNLTAPKAQKKRRESAAPADPLDEAVKLAEPYMRKFVEPALRAEEESFTRDGVTPQEYLRGARDCYLEILGDTSFYPATLVAGVVLNLRRAGEGLAALDPTREVPAETLVKVMATRVYRSQARARTACMHITGLTNAQKAMLGREITHATLMLTEIARGHGIALPPDPAANAKLAPSVPQAT